MWMRSFSSVTASAGQLLTQRPHLMQPTWQTLRHGLEPVLGGTEDHHPGASRNEFQHVAGAGFRALSAARTLGGVHPRKAAPALRWRRRGTPARSPRSRGTNRSTNPNRPPDRRPPHTKAYPDDRSAGPRCPPPCHSGGTTPADPRPPPSCRSVRPPQCLFPHLRRSSGSRARWGCVATAVA